MKNRKEITKDFIEIDKKKQKRKSTKKEKPITQYQIWKSKFYVIRHTQWFGILFGTLIGCLISLLIANHFYQRESKEFKDLMKVTTDTSIQKITNAVNKATEESKKEIKKILQKEITEAVFPNDFSLIIDGKDYSPGSTCEIKSKTKEIKPYFAVKNNSKYPAKDITIGIYFEKNTIKEGIQALEKGFLANGASRILGGQTTPNLEGMGFVIPSPIYHNHLRYIHSLELQMIKNKTTIIVKINGQHKFYLVYNISKNDEKEIPKTLDSPIRPKNDKTKQTDGKQTI